MTNDKTDLQMRLSFKLSDLKTHKAESFDMGLKDPDHEKKAFYYFVKPGLFIKTSPAHDSCAAGSRHPQPVELKGTANRQN